MAKSKKAGILGSLFCALCIVLVLGFFITTDTSQAQQVETATPAAPAEETATSRATAIPAHAAPGSSASLQGFSYIRQTWNNCGPATLAMLLSHYGSDLDQTTIGAALRPNNDDKNVTPIELAEYARSQGYRAMVRVDGDRERLRTLLANGIPTIIETWLQPHPNDGLGHYRLLVGYDDAQSHWIGYDSYYRENLVNPGGEYQGIRMDYDQTDELWRVFNRTYVIVFPEEQAETVASILGEDGDDGTMWAGALETARTATEENDNDPFAWFNTGTALTALGRYEEASVAYDRARDLGLPPRMFWYQFGPFQVYYEVGRYEDVVTLADQVMNPAVQIEELHYWKAEALQALNDPQRAEQAAQRVAQLNPNYRPHYGTIPAVQAAAVPPDVTPTPTTLPTADSEPATDAAQPVDEPTSGRLVRAGFVADVTIPDGMVVSPGERLEKVWRVRNDGDAPWEGYTLQPLAISGAGSGQLDTSGPVTVATTAPGETVDIRLEITAPAEPGYYTSYWQIATGDGDLVAGGQVWTIFEVAEGEDSGDRNEAGTT